MRIPRSVLVLMTAAALNGCDAPLGSDDAGAAYAGDGGDAAILVDPNAAQGSASAIIIDDIAITNALGAPAEPPAPAEGGSNDEGETGDTGEGELETLEPEALENLLRRDFFYGGDPCPWCGMG